VPSNLPIDGHSFRRVEVLTGSPRRRRWSDEEKAAIVAESQVPGAQAERDRVALRAASQPAL
jgi:transposase-like protein